MARPEPLDHALLAGTEGLAQRCLDHPLPALAIWKGSAIPALPAARVHAITNRSSSLGSGSDDAECKRRPIGNNVSISDVDHGPFPQMRSSSRVVEQQMD